LSSGKESLLNRRKWKDKENTIWTSKHTLQELTKVESIELSPKLGVVD
jgi:hypothetical protein